MRYYLLSLLLSSLLCVAAGRIGSEKAVDPLMKALTDRDSFVRERAAEELEEISKRLKKRIIVKEKEI